MNKKYTIDKIDKYIQTIKYTLRNKINLFEFVEADWIVSFTELDEFVSPVQYNGILLPPQYVLLNGVLYREDKMGNLKLVPIYNEHRRNKYRVWIPEQNRILSIWQGSLVKQNFCHRIPNSFHVHHLDGDSSNNHPTNLVMIESFIHNTFHGTKISNRVSREKFIKEFLK